MGTSTDGILCYGVALEEEDEKPAFMGEYDELDELLCAEAGVPLWGEEGYSYERKKEFLKTQPVEMVTHCSYNCPMYIIAVRGYSFTASRGYPEDLGQQIVLPSEDEIQHFMDWMEKHGFEDYEPRWLLASVWG